MSLVPRPFAYDSNPQAVYHRQHDDPFLELREVASAVYDLSADAGQLKSPNSGSMPHAAIEAAAAGKLYFFRIAGDSQLEDPVLIPVRAGDLDWTAVAPDTPSSDANSAAIFQFMPAFTILGTQFSGSSDVTINPVRYRVSASSAGANVLLARTAVHTGNLTLGLYEAH